MPAGPGEDAERFAAAVELGRSPDSWLDDELARDLEIVAMLRSRARDFNPSPAAKAQAKQRLMALLAEPAADERADGGRVLAPAFPSSTTGAADNAVTELLPQVPDASGVAQADGSRSTEPQSAEPGPVEATRLDLAPDSDPESDPDSEVEPGPPALGHGTPTRPARLTRSRRAGAGRHSRPGRPAGRAGNSYPLGAAGRRFTLVGSAALVLALALAGAGILVSRDALPGEGLYGVKRVAEEAGLAMTFDETSRARRHLDLASTRLGEVEQLIADDPKVSSEDPQLVTETIQQFDDSAGEGARIMLAGNNADNAGARDELRSWAAEQSTRLAGLQPVLPAGAGAEDALRLLHRVVGRTAALQQQDACATPPSSVDDLGPVPSCQPAGVDAAGVDPTTGLPSTAGDPTVAGSTSDPTGAGRSTSADAGSAAGSASTAGSGSNPNTSRQTPAQQDDPSLLDPVEDTLGGVLGGGSKDTQSSTAPSSSNDDQKSSDNGGGGGGGLPPINLPLPGLGGIGIG
ncbi:MAG TPA: DUF5667 domain-containing protein [Pseudonocardia sp.]|nr:DUF5667 domain-containing protein [Pseudonocardia sp.]